MKNVLVIPKKKKDSYEIKPVITLICPERKKIKKAEYIKPTYHTEPGDPDSLLYAIQVPHFGDGPPEEYLAWLDLLKEALSGQHITDGPGMFNCTERVLTGDALAFFKHNTLELPNGHTRNVFDNVLTCSCFSGICIL